LTYKQALDNSCRTTASPPTDSSHCRKQSKAHTRVSSAASRETERQTKEERESPETRGPRPSRRRAHVKAAWPSAPADDGPIDNLGALCLFLLLHSTSTSAPARPILYPRLNPDPPQPSGLFRFAPSLNNTQHTARMPPGLSICPVHLLNACRRTNSRFRSVKFRPIHCHAVSASSPCSVG
jgi:hypothetical protein